MPAPTSRNQIDMMCFILAMKEYVRLGGEEAHYKKGVQLLKRYKDVFEEMVQDLLVPMAEGDFTGLATLDTELNRALRGTLDTQIVEVASCA